jgi:hypothetical protein
MIDQTNDDDMPLRLVFCPGISSGELLAQLQSDCWRGLPILPVGNKVRIIQLRGRWEPELEDTP